jgi:DNA-binding transcriptional regulator GbsR (MarR family)
MEDTERFFIDKTGDIASQWGFGEPTGRVWATLLFAEKPLSQKDIAEKTGYTLSLVSPTLKILENTQRVTKVRGEGKERLYELNGSFIDTFGAMMNRIIERDLRPVIEELKKSNLKNKKKISSLIAEYQMMESHLMILMKLINAKKATYQKIKRLIGG